MTIQDEIKQAISALANVSALLYRLSMRDAELSTSCNKEFERVFLGAHPLDRRQESVVLKLNNRRKREDVVLTSEEKKMIIKIPGVSVNSKPRKDGRFQAYVTENGKRRYLYGLTYNELLGKIKSYFDFGLPESKKESNTLNGVPKNFHSFATYYFKHFRSKKVNEKTFEKDMLRYNKYIKPYFKDTPLKKITPLFCQELIETITDSGKTKTAEEVFNLLSLIFKMAINHSLINKNPLDIVMRVGHERQHGSAFTSAELTQFLDIISNTVDEPAFMLALYTGLRPNELSTARIENGFIVAINSKRKTRKIEYKKIPIHKSLAPYLTNGVPFANLKRLRTTIKEHFPTHKLYDLRTTFYSRCKECGISEHAYKEFMGHSLGAVGNAYTDLSNEFLKKEMQKFKSYGKI